MSIMAALYRGNWRRLNEQTIENQTGTDAALLRVCIPILLFRKLPDPES